MEMLLKTASEEEANTWVATEYWTQYGTKVGVTDEYYVEPIHMVLAMYFANSKNTTHNIGECNPGGVTIQEYRENGSLYCERRLYHVVKEVK